MIYTLGTDPRPKYITGVGRGVARHGTHDQQAKQAAVAAGAAIPMTSRICRWAFRSLSLGKTHEYR